MKLRKPSHVIVLERAGDQCKVLEAAISGSALLIRRASVVPKAASGAGGADTLPHLNNRAEVILLATSDRSICRMMKMPAASAEDTMRMVALRLETELPYPLADSLWACERAGAPDAGSGSPVLVLATPREEIAASERMLGFAGRNPWAVQLDAAALAELVPATAPIVETVALCRIGERATDLVIVRQGKLQYARRLFVGCAGAPDAAAVRRLCGELDQCIHHYALSSETAEPKRLLIVGEGSRAGGLAQALQQATGMPAEVLTIPAAVQLNGRVGAGNALLAEFPACIGALLAVQRRQRGERAAAPPLRRRKTPLLASVPHRRAALAGIAVALAVALAAASFGVRMARIAEAARAVRKGQPFLQDMDRLKNEVDILQYEDGLQRPLLDTLLALAETLPKSLKLATLNISPSGKVVITGTCPNAEEAGKAKDALKAGKTFTNPKLGNLTKQEQEYKFTMTCELKSAPGGGTP